MKFIIEIIKPSKWLTNPSFFFALYDKAIEYFSVNDHILFSFLKYDQNIYSSRRKLYKKSQIKIASDVIKSNNCENLMINNGRYVSLDSRKSDTIIPTLDLTVYFGPNDLRESLHSGLFQKKVTGVGRVVFLIEVDNARDRLIDAKCLAKLMNDFILHSGASYGVLTPIPIYHQYTFHHFSFETLMSTGWEIGHRDGYATSHFRVTWPGWAMTITKNHLDLLGDDLNKVKQYFRIEDVAENIKTIYLSDDLLFTGDDGLNEQSLAEVKAFIKLVPSLIPRASDYDDTVEELMLSDYPEERLRRLLSAKEAPYPEKQPRWPLVPKKVSN